MIGLVAVEICPFLDGKPHGFVQVLEEQGRLLEQAMGCLLVKIEAVSLEVLHYALHRHGVQISQLRDSGDEGAVEARVLQWR